MEQIIKSERRLRTLKEWDDRYGNEGYYRYVTEVGFLKGFIRVLSNLSWTDDLDRARWFANRLGARHGDAVYKVTVSREMVLARFNNSRHEKEWVLNAPEFMDDDVELMEDDV